MSNIRFIFTGAQGTGKTTILNHFKEAGYNVITEVVRNLSREGVKINEMGDNDGQLKIFNTYHKLLSEQTEYISDRGLSDVVAYTYDLHLQDRVSKEELEREVNSFVRFCNEHPDVIYFYFPIEFAVVSDGVRSEDEGYRKRIDKNILDLLKTADVPYIEVKGTVEERIKIVERVLNLI